MNAELILARDTECISERMGKRSSFYLVVEPRKNNRSIFKRLMNFGGNIRSEKNRDKKMALTRDFKETVKKRVQSDPVFREELLKEGVQCLVSGDMETGKTILRDYINATVGFEELGDLTDKSPKSLMRMFGPKGNPQARNLFEIIECLQKREGICFEVKAVH